MERTPGTHACPAKTIIAERLIMQQEPPPPSQRKGPSYEKAEPEPEPVDKESGH